ncbi:Protein of unknown function [Bacillus cereus]|jgi:hypothetical protein
MLFT